MKFTILGCGNSTGVPAIGNVWGACDPNESKNRRTRCSLLVESATTKIVIDTGPDFHAQLTRHNIQAIDAVLYTHAHSDHMAGIDDIRAITFRRKSVTPVFGSRETMDELTRLYDYLFFGGKSKIYPPILEHHIFEYENKIQVGDIEFSTFAMDHGTCVSTGYRFGDFAYATDFLRLDDRAVAALKGVKVWIADAAGYKETGNKVHANLETLYALNQKIGAEQVYLTSLSLSMDYKTLCAELPPGFAPAWDGLVIDA